MRKVHRISTLVVCLLVSAVNTVMIAASAYAQPGSSQPKTAPARTFAYDVVSIKPHQFGDRKLSFGPTEQGYAAKNIMVSFLVQYAYDLKPDQISALPGWTSVDRFDLEAKMDEQTAAELKELPPDERMRLREQMMQTVLADRFKLQVHRGTKDEPVYALVVAKGGCKLKQSPSDESSKMMTASGRIVMQAMPISALIDNLPSSAGRIVIDKTGLNGSYDFTLQWAPEGSDPSDPRPSLFTALEEQLGLKLVSSAAPVDILVIDHIERPSAN
jgi:uncharacterized protein (TIGR03435 family)